MFRIQISGTVEIEGCPADGLPAIDFRTAHGLPRAPRNTLRLPEADAESELVCRRFPGLLDSDADLLVPDSVLVPDGPRIPQIARPENLRRFLTQPRSEEALSALIADLAENRAEAAWRAARAARAAAAQK